MESYDTKIKCFGGLDFSQQQSFLFKPKSDELLSFFFKKKRKIKFGNKYIFFKIIGTGYLID